MNGLSKLGTVLLVVFSVLIVAILAEICYVLSRRIKFRQRNRVVEDGPEQFSSDPFSHNQHPPSKELLYFFCWKKTQTPIEPHGFHPTRVQPDAPPVVDSDDVLMKWQLGLYGPSRLLFTIKEEEREDVADSPVAKTTTTTTTRREVVSLEEECFGGCDGGGVDDEEATPFSTPCMSPFYYTPAASPTREVGNNGGGGGNMTTDSTGNDDYDGTVTFVSLEVHGR